MQISERASDVAVISTSGHVDASVSPTLDFQCTASGRHVRVREDTFETQPAVICADQGGVASAVISGSSSTGIAAESQAAARLCLTSLRGDIELKCRSWRSSIEQRLLALRGA